MEATAKQPGRRDRSQERAFVEPAASKALLTDQEINQLARMAQRGVLSARDGLWAYLEPALLAQCKYYLRRSSTAPSVWLEAADLRQQCFLIFCDILAEWEPARASFLPCVLKLLRGRLAHYVRHAMRSAKLVSLDAIEAWDLLVQEDPAPVLDSRIFLEELLACLTSAERVLFCRHVVDGVPMYRAAQEAGVTERTAYRLFQEARTKMKIRLADWGVGDAHEGVRVVRILGHAMAAAASERRAA